METSGGVAPGEWSPTEAVSFGWEKVRIYERLGAGQAAGPAAPTVF